MMRMKIIINLLLVSLLISTTCFANDADLFSYDEQKIENELSEISQLEAFLLQNNGTTYSDLLMSENEIAGALSYSNSGFMNFAMLEPPLGIPSFLWGFCFGAVGMLVVYVVSEDRDETMKALWGCVAGTVLWGVIYFVAFAAASSA